MLFNYLSELTYSIVLIVSILDKLPHHSHNYNLYYCPLNNIILSSMFIFSLYPFLHFFFRILILIDNLGSKIPVEETEVVTYTRNSFSLAVHINDSRASSPMFGEDNNAGIILPTPLINSITFNTTMSRVVFSYYTTNALFQTVNRRNDSTLVSDVWSVTVPNTRVTDLDENSSVIIRLGNIEVSQLIYDLITYDFVI